jgi:hypothetical protein
MNMMEMNQFMKTIVLGSILFLSGCMHAGNNNIKNGTYIIEACDGLLVIGKGFVPIDCSVKHIKHYNGSLDYE